MNKYKMLCNFDDFRWKLSAGPSTISEFRWVIRNTNYFTDVDKQTTVLLIYISILTMSIQKLINPKMHVIITF